MVEQKIRNWENASTVCTHAVIFHQDWIVGGGQEVVPSDVRLGESIGRRGEPELKGNCVAYCTLFYLIFHGYDRIWCKIADRRRPRTRKWRLNCTHGWAPIVIDQITIVAPLRCSHINPISAFGTALIGGSAVVVPRSVVAVYANVGVSWRTIETTRHQTF